MYLVLMMKSVQSILKVSQSAVSGEVTIPQTPQLFNLPLKLFMPGWSVGAQLFIYFQSFHRAKITGP